MESWVRVLVLVACLFPALVESRVRHYKFNVVMKTANRLCSSKPIVTVNKRSPGPILYAREGDTVLVKVVNHVQYNVSIHWHGIRQLRTGWADGPAYITQCPIQPGQNFVYKFTITGQRGTLLWHAHILWLRATVYGALVILPKLGVPYPFPAPHKEVVVILGEWWKSDTEAVINEALKSGLAPNVSDAHTINGHPGPVSNCSSQGGFTLHVESGKRYMLRIINAALNEELFFKIAGHQLTVVEVDATYTKPFKTNTILIAPGQTTNVLLTANRGTGKYLVTASPFMDSPITVDNMTATATLHYSGTLANTATTLTNPPPKNATPIASSFINSLRSLNSKKYPAKVPLTVDHSLFFTVGLGFNPCTTCANGGRVMASINNVSFVMPTTALLQAHFFNISGVFTDDFPGNPPMAFNYTGTPPTNLQTMTGTRLYRLPYNSTVQVVLQDTGIIAAENHPVHLHGFNFFEVGRGVGNFNSKKDPKKFNLVDPVERNTIGVPSGGWAAFRFRADNPGVWFMHCHLEVHTTWGLKMAFVVDNGKGPKQSLLPPPKDLPKSSHFPDSDWIHEQTKNTKWTREENKRFENALAVYDEYTPNRWHKVAAMIPGKTVVDVWNQYKELEDDVGYIEAGLVPVPGYSNTSSFTLEWLNNNGFDGFRQSYSPGGKRCSSARPSDQERKKGIPWTEDEHRLFLMGLKKYGKGDWRNISRNFVITRTPTQVASHAQKYFIRQVSGGKDKRRSSIHDITTINLADNILPSPDNNRPLSPDQSTLFPQYPNSAGTPRVLLDWNRPSDGLAMVFNSNLFMPPPCGINSYGLLQGQNLSRGALQQSYVGPHKTVFQMQSTQCYPHG
ncbi:hypothetical protein HHK36_010789 [Tetracentron sinense]|uniref:Laccase n=1 Tax=Tetracentron sinense TaxID=13715 RepID=A0A834ZAZ9_TETSI|nr:hypothetical protein HHK36_010789 [Tetracentron sinense]